MTQFKTQEQISISMTCCGAYTSKVLANVANVMPRDYFSLTRMEHFSVFFPTLSLTT